MNTSSDCDNLPPEAKDAIARAELAKETHYRNIVDPTLEDMRYTLEIAKTFTGPGYHTIIHFMDYFPEEPEKEALIEEIRALPNSCGVYVLTGYKRIKALLHKDKKTCIME
jgi:hypothetical protein